jgi:hypothetical protein
MDDLAEKEVQFEGILAVSAVFIFLLEGRSPFSVTRLLGRCLHGPSRMSGLEEISEVAGDIVVDDQKLSLGILLLYSA